VEGPSTRLRLRVNPRAGRSAIVGRHGESWKVSIAAAPEGGKANDAMLDLLSQILGVPRRSLGLAAGSASRDKIVVLEGLTEAEAESKLAAAAGAAG